MDKENLEEKAKTTISFLKKVDKYLFEYWKPIFFGYFVFAIVVMIAGTRIEEDLFPILEYSNPSRRNLMHIVILGWNFLLLWSPLIIAIVWKKIFHPKD